MSENELGDQTPTANGWLGLLARDASMDEVRAYRRTLLSGATAAQRIVIERESNQTMDILQRLAERREHADELMVLNDLAKRLASLHEERSLLQEVSSQARRLLSADVAYLMLRQDNVKPNRENSGLLRIEVSDGSLGSVLPGTELGLGEGLGGQVLRAGQPLWTEDYLHDTQIPHLHHVDQVASSEHLGGILGVPLTVGEQTLGVLFAANRRPRKFTGREIELLAALAAHACVAIRNSQLYEQHQRSVAVFRSAVAELEEANATRQRAFDLRERLTQSVIRGGAPAQILAELRSSVNVPVRFEDADNAEFAQLFSGSTTDAPILTTAGGMHRVAVPVLLATGYGGAVVADSPEPLDGEALRMLPLGATSIAILVASQRSLAEMEMRTRSEFLATALGSHVNEDSVRRHAGAVGIEIDSISAVMVVSADPGAQQSGEARRLALRVAQHFHGWSGQYGEHLVTLLPETTVEAVKALTVQHGPQLPGAIGLAASGGGIAGLRAAYLSAAQTTSLLNALGRPHDIAEDHELGIYRSVFSQAGRNEISLFVTQCVGKILDYDSERGSDLALTLSTYLETSQHHARTCAALHIHANTLYNRLERIDKLIGPGWKDSSRNLDLQLALRLNRLISTIAQHHDGR